MYHLIKIQTVFTQHDLRLYEKKNSVYSRKGELACVF